MKLNSVSKKIVRDQVETPESMQDWEIQDWYRERKSIYMYRIIADRI